MNGAGATVSGASNVLCAFMASAVSTRPDTAENWAPRNDASTVRGAFGSRFASVTRVRPSFVEADALTAGIVSPPCE